MAILAATVRRTHGMHHVSYMHWPPVAITIAFTLSQTLHYLHLTQTFGLSIGFNHTMLHQAALWLFQQRHSQHANTALQTGATATA